MSRKGWALFGALGVVWGIPFLLIKVADNGGISVWFLVFSRVFVGAALLLPAAIRRGTLRQLRTRWPWVVALSVVEVILPWLLLSAAEQHLSSSVSGLILAATPIVGIGVARLAGDRERLTLTRAAGLVIGLGGMVLLVGPALAGGGTLPVLEAAGTAVCYAIGPVIAARKLAGLDSLSLTAASLSLASAVYVIPATLTPPHHLPAASVLGALLGLAIVCTALAFLLYLALIAEAGPVRAEVVTYVNPAVAVVLGVAVLGEPLTPMMIGAFGLILAGSVLATTRSGIKGGCVDHAGVAKARCRAVIRSATRPA